MARSVHHMATQSQLGSFATTKFISEDPLLGVVSSHRWAMLRSHPRVSPTVPPTSSRQDRTFPRGHACPRRAGRGRVHMGRQRGQTP